MGRWVVEVFGWVDRWVVGSGVWGAGRAVSQTCI